MRRSKADVERYIASVQGSAPSPREKSMKGFYFAKLYYEAKEYDLAKKYISTYINVQERDPKAHRFLGLLYEVEENIDKAVECYKRSVELNPTQKDLVLKIAELLCKNDVTDGRAKYWVERAAKLFPGSPAIYKLKEQLLDCKGEDGWNKLFDLIQSELYARPDDIHVNIRLVELYRSNKRLKDAVAHCHEADRNTALRSSLEWNLCVVQTLKEYLESLQCLDSDKSTWRATNKDLLLAYANLMLLTLSTRDVQEGRELLESFDSALQSVKSSVGGNDELSATFLETKGHFYMHVGSLLLKMGQQSDIQWRALSELAALCYLVAFQVPRPKVKLIKGEAGQNLLETMAHDRLSQSGHMLLNLSRGKQDFLKEVVESFANKSGQSALCDALFSSQSSKERSFLGNDDIGNLDGQVPDPDDLARYDTGAVRAHNGSLQHLTWLGLQWNSLSTLPAIRKWLKQLFHHLPQETSRLETNAPESICILDLEVFLLGVIYTSHLQLKEKCNSHHTSYQPLCLPLPVCRQLCTERQKTWWDAVCTLIHRKALPGTSAKLRLLVQREINSLRGQEKHGLQPALLVHWAQSLQKTGSSLNSFYDQREYIGRSVHYWRKVLPLLKMIRKKNSIPEPIDPLFKHFHSVDIQASEIGEYEEDAHITFAILDAVNGNIEDAMTAFESIKNVVSYWNLALIFHRKAEDIENDALSPEEQEECKNYLRKTRDYLIRILDDSDSNTSVVQKLPVPLESVKEMLNSVMQELEDYSEGGTLYKNGCWRSADSELKHSTPSPTKYSLSPSKSYKYSPKTPPRWAEDQNSLLKMICQQVEAIKKEMQELKLNSNNSASPHRWPAEPYGQDPAPDGYQGSQTFHGAPLTVATTGPSVYYSQSPAYNSQYLLRPAANVTPTKGPVYGMNRLPPQQHIYAYSQQMHTPPVQSSSACMFSQEMYGPPLRFESPATGILSPRGDDYFNYNVQQTSTNPPLPEPGYFTKPPLVAHASRSAESKVIEFGKSNFVQPMQGEVIRPPLTTPAHTTQPTPFKFNSNFKSNDGDFTFSSPQVVAQPPSTAYSNSESLLGLLTSDKPLQGDGYSGLKPISGQASGSRNTFSFGSKNTLTENMGPNQQKNFGFHRSDDMFAFHGPGKSVFTTAASELANKSHETDGGSAHGDEEDDGPHFEPVVPLPDKIEVKTGEEDEEEFFCNRAKLFRFDGESKEWKERGIGNVKILRHKTSGKIRLLMRREQVLKICANHYISPDMKLTPNAGSDRSFVWHALDYADELPKPEQLAIRFKTPEEAALFKCKFEEAQNILKALGTNTSTAPNHTLRIVKESATQDNKDICKADGGNLNFEFQIVKKEGPYWNCNSCSFKNAATAKKCVSCQNTNPTSNKELLGPPLVENGFAPKTGLENAQDRFATMTANKEGHWDCSVCLVRNEPTVSRCIACQNTKSASSFVQTSFKFGQGDLPKSVDSDFRSVFSKKEGQWECSVCLVRNERSAKKCVACENPGKQFKEWHCSLCSVKNEAHAIKCVACNNPVTPSLSTAPPSFKFGTSEMSKPFRIGFEGMFAKKEGQWDCSLCFVRNEASATHCIACQYPNKQNQPTSCVSAPASSETSRSPKSGFEGLFPKKEGEWECAVCSVQNESSSLKCVACEASKPTHKPHEAPSAFTVGSKSQSNESAGSQVGTEFKSNFPEKNFKVGISEQKFKFGHVDQEKTPSFAFQGGSNTEFKSIKDGFSFCIPVSADGFKFGIQEKGNQEKKSEKHLENDPSFQAHDTSGQKNGSGVVFGQTSSTFTFADLAKSTSREGFQFGKKDPNFKGFSGAGEKLFSSQSGKVAEKANTSSDLEKDDDAYKTEDSDDIHFEPVVQMPEKVELVTGEEDEKVLYSQRVKLFRFDAEISQWKERGLGNLKILKNEVNGKLRMLMRREQVLKVCANHWITTTMNLKPLSGSDRAWMWLASDFSDGDAKLEQLAAKFKTPELAEEFKQKFEECQRLLLDIPLQTPHKLVDTGRAAKLIQRAEEMKSGLKDFKTFLTNDQVKVTDEENASSGADAPSASDTTAKQNPDNTGPALEWDNYDLREDALDDSVSSSSVHASPLASSPVRKNLFRFGESTTGFNFSFKSALSPSKSPAKLNQSGASVGTDEESDVTQEEERDGQYFEPVVPLPDLVEVSSGEENEQVVFSHRAKLYRYDKDVGQWKERGIGDIKILQNYDNKQVRIVMRRDQVLKLCANHRITPDMTLQTMKGTERVWVWTACDFADGERKIEHLAVRFKLQDVADSFKKIFDEAKTAQEKDSLITPHVSHLSTPRESPCGKIAIAVLEETTRERTDLTQGDEVIDTTSEAGETSSTSETTPKAVVSPPKFVFGSESVKSIFSSEKSKPFAFGNSSATGSLFGFSFNAPLKNSNSEMTSRVQSGSEGKVKPDKCELPQNSDIKQSSDGKVKNLSAFSKENSSTSYTFKTPEKAQEKSKPEDLPSDNDILIVYELTPTPEQKALAEKLLLPSTFFCYKNRPGYVSEEEEDDEDYEMAVKKLNGKLYLDDSEKPLEELGGGGELHPRTGRLVSLSACGRTARRQQPGQEFNHGLVLSREPLRDGRVFTVRIDRKVNSWSGSIEIGVTALDPSVLDFPSSATGLKGGSWVVSGCSVLRDGRSVLEEYGQDLDQLVEGDRVGVERTATGELRLWVNGRDCGVAATGLPARVWAVVDLYGKCTQITVLPSEPGFSPPTPVPTPPLEPLAPPEDSALLEQGTSVDEAFMVSPAQARPETFPNSLDSHNDFASMELSEVVSNAILSAYNGGLLNVSLSSPPAGDGLASSGPATSPILTSNDALLFHEKCGTLIKLSNNNKTAERRRPLDEFNNGVVMTNRPLRDNEMFEIRIDKLVDKWSGSIEIGVTTHNPNSLEYPATMTNLQSGTIMMSGCGILTNGKGTRREYCEFSLDELQEGDHIGLTRKSNSALHFFINGIDQGVATPLTPPVVYGVVDLYGMAVKVTIVHNNNHSDRLRRNNAILRALSPEGALRRAAPAAQAEPERLLFHPNCGQKAAITHEGRTALRPHATDDFNHGVVLSSRALRDGEVFQVRIDKMVDKWAGSIEIGVTTHNPAYLQLPSTMTNLRSGTWMMTGNGVMHNGTTILDEYGHNLDRLKAGDTVGVVRREDGTLHFFVNGMTQGPAAWNVPPGVYAVVDLYGQAAQATIVDDVEVPPVSEPLPEGNNQMSPSSPSSAAGGSDLRFHQLHGSNAVITNGGRTALRHNCRSEFNDAIVISNRALRDGELFEIVIQKMVDRWSGSIEAGVTAIRPEDLEFPNTMTDIDYDTWMLSGTAIMQDGNTMRNNYGCDLDALGTGARIGMMRTAKGDLHYFINGQDQGAACSGLPPGKEVYAVVDLYGQCVQVSITNATGPMDNSLATSNTATEKSFPLHSPVAGVAHRFHSMCGKNVTLEEDGTRAVRVAGYAHGLVFSTKELKAEEVFEVKVEELDEKWAGSLRLGLTTLAPEDMGPGAGSGPGLPPSLPELRTKTTWMVSSCEVRRDGHLQRMNYGRNLERLGVGSRVGIRRCADDTMHILVDGEDMGPAAAGIAKNVWAVLDLYGPVRSVAIVSSTRLEEPEGTQPPSPSSDTGSEVEEDDEVEEQGLRGQNQVGIVPTALEFLENHGKNILLSNGNRTATRVASYNQGIVVISQPLVPHMLVQVRIDFLNRQWTSSLVLGVITCPPERLNFPASACALKRAAWLLRGRGVFHNGLKICEKFGPNLDTCPEGTILGLRLDSSGGLHLHINGVDQGVAVPDVPQPCHALVDLYGQCEQVTIVSPDPGTASGKIAGTQGDMEKADMVDGIKESVCWGPPPAASPLKSCEYHALCSRFQELLLLPEDYFMPPPKRSLCYCESCRKLRGDEAHRRRGEPPREYALPFGWCRFNLRVNPHLEAGTLTKKWHMAYHGSSVAVVRRVLDRGELGAGTTSILSCRPLKGEPGVGFEEPGENCAPPREEQPPPVLLSPSLQYAGAEMLASKVQFRDPKSQRTHQAQVAFQVCVRPGSYTPGPPSAALRELPDQHFSPSELEWVTKEKGATLLYALLVRVE